MSGGRKDTSGSGVRVCVCACVSFACRGGGVEPYGGVIEEF